MDSSYIGLESGIGQGSSV